VAGLSNAAALAVKYADSPTVRLLVVSELHKDEEYGGPFWCGPTHLIPP